MVVAQSDKQEGVHAYLPLRCARELRGIAGEMLCTLQVVFFLRRTKRAEKTEAAEF
jgi:hypothetical protein